MGRKDLPEQAALKNRRASNAKKSLRHIEIRPGITLPDQLAGLQLKARQLSLRAKSVTRIRGQERRRARAIIVAVGIDEMARIIEDP